MMMYEIIDCFKSKGIINQRLRFVLPLSYYENNNKFIAVVANLTQKYDQELHSTKNLWNELVLPKKPKVIAYLQGGPGFPCSVPLSNSGFTKVLLDRGYQVLYIDQRGTGLSTPLEVETFNKMVPKNSDSDDESHTQKQLQFILNFRADSIVEDFERIRKAILGDNKWSLLGQSYGGFCSFTYLSKYPDSLKEVLLTGGVPPVNHGPDDVYSATYERTKERNIHYYDKYPQDISKVRRILDYLDINKPLLPNGGCLSVERFQQLGLNFGGNGGTDSIHQVVFKFDYDLESYGYPTYQTLNTIQNAMSFDTNIIYALFQEAIYLDGNNPNLEASNWSANRLRSKVNKNFTYSSNSQVPIFFTGEMVYKSMFDDYAELREFKNLAYALHAEKKWSALYDVNILRSISWKRVPIVAAAYVYDQYVDFDLTRKVKREVFEENGNLKFFATSDFFHSGIRVEPEKVLGSLFDLLDDEID